MRNAQPPLVDAVGKFIEQHAMSPVTFGRLAVRDPHFVRDLRGEGRARPRRVWPETDERVRQFMATYRPSTEGVRA